jgi:hypothetical protein
VNASTKTPVLGERIAKLEATLPALATKSDVADAKVSIITFTASFGGAMAAIVVAVLLFAINRASPLLTVLPQPQVAAVMAAPTAQESHTSAAKKPK